MENKIKEKEEKSTSDREYWMFALRIVTEFGGIIALPAVLFALLGRYLDERFRTMPWLLILCLAIALTFSAITVWRRAKELGKEYEKL